jgi:hypothetical protein
MVGLQEELFPIATDREIMQVKSLLSRYRRMKAVIAELERSGIDALAPKQKAVYDAYKVSIEDIDRAVRLILDDEVKRIVEMRYIRGERHKVTVIYFSSMHPSTVDRKINEGIRSVANTLKLWL